MTATGPWSVKGIDPKAREIAKDLARRSGMTLGDWLNQVIIEGGESEAASPPPLPPRRGLDELYRQAQAARRSAESPSVPIDTDGARLARAVESLSSRVEAGEQRASLAISGIDQSMLGVLSRLDELDREHVATGARVSSLLTEVRAAQTAIAERLRRASDDSASSARLQALQAGLSQLVARMDEAGETRAAAEELARRVERVETVMEAAPAAFADAEKVETVLTRMAERLDQNDTKTDAAMQSLQSSFANLDARLRTGEARLANLGGHDLERRFQGLAHELMQRVEGARNELSQRLRAVAEGRIDKVEAGLKDLGGQVALAEKRSAQAIDRMGREVMRVAHSLGERVDAAEQAGDDLVARTDARMATLEAQTETRVAGMEARSAAAAEAMAGEMARAASVMEARLRDADGAQALALEKLGGEIERIAERLAERIAAADRRQAEAIDEVTDKVATSGARFAERHDQVSGEITDRIRASETRTAELVEEARGRLSRAVGEPTHAEDLVPFVPPPPLAAVAEAPAPPAKPMPAAEPFAEPFPAYEPTAYEPTTYEQTAYEPQADGFPDEEPPVDGAGLSNADPFAFPEPAAPMREPEPVEAGWSAESDPFAGRGASGQDSPFDPDDDFLPAHPSLAPEPAFAPAAVAGPAVAPPSVSAAAEAFAPEPEPEPEPFEPAFSGFSVSDFAPAALESEPVEEARPEQLSTRQMLDAARQAARRAALGKGADAALADGSVPVPPRDAKAQAPRPFGITFPGLRKKETTPTLRTFVLASGIAGSLTAMGVGAYLMGETVNQSSPLASEVAASGAPGDAAVLAPSAAPNAALALTPPLSAPVLAAPPPSAPATTAKATSAPAPTQAAAPASAPSPEKLYASAVGRLESGDLGALPDLRTAADRGSTAAQFYLARLYDQGGAGLAKDPVQARRLTERAAEGGDPSAMYNLASYLYAGEGGGKDPAKAADWFRKAAEHGVVNGQYNLAQLYEKGYGIGQSDAEAYKWYLVAAASGDSESRVAAAALKPRLSADTQAAAEHAAALVRAGLDEGVKTAATVTLRTP
jgi:localization factor PodJL